MAAKEDIAKFVQEMGAKYGPIPKWNLSNQKNKLYYNTPFVDDLELIAAIETFLMGKWVTSGAKVNEFEEEYCKLVNNKYGLAVNSGSSGDLIMVAAVKEHLGWPNGDECIISAVGFPSTFSALIINNLRPILVDVKLDDLNFDVSKIEEKITSRTRAIFNSPVLGNTSSIDELIRICEKYNLKLLQDHADSLGTKWLGKELTEYAFASSCSTYLAHHINLGGHSGIISSNNKDVIDIAKCMSRWGSLCTCPSGLSACKQGICGRRFDFWLPSEPTLLVDHRYVYGYLAYNTQVAMDLMGAIGLEQIKKFPTIHKNRVINKNRVERLFKKYLPEVSSLTVLPECEPSWFGTPIRTPDNQYKIKLVNYLEANGIQTRNCFAGLITLHKPYSHLSNELFPNARKVLEEYFFMGANPNWNEENFAYLEQVLKNYK